MSSSTLVTEVPPPSISSVSGAKFAIDSSFSVGENGTETFTAQFDPEAKCFATGSSNGTIQIYSTFSEKPLGTITGPPHAITGIRWRPLQGGWSTAKSFLTVSAQGQINYWNAMTGECIASSKDQEGNDLYCVDFKKDGGQFAVGGKDYSVKIYDLNTMTIKSIFSKETTEIGHSNRVFSVHYADDPNLLVSGGFDNAIFFWDLRQSQPTGFIMGPHIAGDSICLAGNNMLTGSYHNTDVLQLWDLSKQKLIENIPWDPALKYSDTCLYAAVFDKDPYKTGCRKYIAAGGACKNELRIFKAGGKHDLVAKATFPKAVTSIDFAANTNVFIVGCGNGHTYVYSFDDD